MRQLDTISLWGAQTIDTGIAGGIAIGAVTCIAVRLSERLRLPSIFSFFEGRRSAPLLLLPLAMFIAYLFLMMWPLLSSKIELFSDW